MTDRRMRDLERAASSGDLAAEASALRERVRAGLLTWELLDLAAYLGHPAAEEFTGRSRVERGESAVGAMRDFGALAAWGEEVPLRALAAVGGAALSAGHTASWLGRPWRGLRGTAQASSFAWTLERMSAGAVWGAINAELVPWALGYSDPLRDRVEARQREARGE